MRVVPPDRDLTAFLPKPGPFVAKLRATVEGGQECTDFPLARHQNFSGPSRFLPDEKGLVGTTRERFPFAATKQREQESNGDESERHA